MTTNDKEWQRIINSVTTNDNKWSEIKIGESKWQGVVQKLCAMTANKKEWF